MDFSLLAFTDQHTLTNILITPHIRTKIIRSLGQHSIIPFTSAATLPNTNVGKQAESKHVVDTLGTNGYPRNFIREVERKRMVTQGATLSPEELVCVFFERVEQNTNEYAVLPYIRGLTEPLKRLLKRYDIKVISKLLRTLNQMLPSPKDRPSEEKQTNVIYQINCADCS